MLGNYILNNKLFSILTLAAIIFSTIIYGVINNHLGSLSPDPKKVISLILSDLVIFLILGILVSKRFLSNFRSKDNPQFSKLRNRIIVAFSLVAAVPTIIVAVFSAYFFNFGIQAWFDNKITTLLDQSLIVAESYINEHTIHLKQSAAETADDFNNMYYELLNKPALFWDNLNAEAEMRSFDEAIIFQRFNSRVLAQTLFSFSISFTTIPSHLIEKANKGEIVEIKSDPTKIRMLVKLKEYDDTYLLVSRLIDRDIINHVNNIDGAVAEYHRLKKHIFSMQIKFATAFILVALILLLAAISWGAFFASHIVRPISKLVEATEKVKEGDLTAQVPESDLRQDELKILSSAFNRMITQINRQQKELVIAQRALAWSDVARSVAHEIKNPLTPIQLAAERLLKKFAQEVDDGETFQKYVNTIIRHTNDIKKIVSEFVNFARLPMPILAKCELVEIIRDIIDSRRLTNDKVSYDFSITHSTIDFICDVTQLNQIIINLLKNSEESFEDSSFPKVQISIIKKDELVSIIIEDNGPGFKPEILAKATEAYVTSKPKGTGLGLAIVKKIVYDHFGALKISNKSTDGAIIELIFNLQELKFKLK